MLGRARIGLVIGAGGRGGKMNKGFDAFAWAFGSPGSNAVRLALGLSGNGRLGTLGGSMGPI